jgi:hypothetical protein
VLQSLQRWVYCVFILLSLHSVAGFFLLLSKIDFRYLQKESEAVVDPFQCYRVPQDFVHLGSGEDPEKLLDLLNLVRNLESTFSNLLIIIIIVSDCVSENSAAK